MTKHQSTKNLCKCIDILNLVGMFLTYSGSKQISKHLERSLVDSTTLWQEVEDSFVSNVVGGQGAGSAKL